MKRKIYPAFRRLVTLGSGYGLRRYFPLVNLLYKKLNNFLSPRRVNVQGHLMYLDDGDSLGLAVSGEYEITETKIVHRYITPGQVVLDIGANIGYFTLQFAHLVGAQGRVYAFEPDPTTFEILKRNVSTNGYRNVVLERTAVSNRSAKAYLQRDQYNNLDHQLVYDSNDLNTVVNTIRLDDYFDLAGETVDFIKLDIQGAEILALEGMQRLLSNSKQVRLLTEFWPAGLERFGGVDAGAQYLGQLEGLGFSIFEIERTTGLLLEKTATALVERYLPSSKEYTNLLCIQRGAEINNNRI